MHDPDEGSQPVTQLKTETAPGVTRVQPEVVDTQAEALPYAELEPGIRADSGSVPSTDVDSRTDAEPSAELDIGAAKDVDDEPTGPHDDEADRLLDLLAQWEERYRRGEDASPETLGVHDPALMKALRDRIDRQKRLYAFMKHSLAEVVAVPESVPARPDTQWGAPAAKVRAGVADGTGPEAPLSYIGRYRIIRILGEGGFGRVHLAHDAELDRDVAIKVPRYRHGSRFLDIESYLKEARVIARLSHPNIVPVYDVGRTQDEQYYIVSKYMEGGDLAARLGRGRLAYAEAAKLIAVVCDALHYSHSHDVFHRDIKPANLLLNAAGAPSLADFGLALKDEDLGKGARHVGTAAYMSPEQARGEGHLVDGRSDIFGLGVVFYELLTGRRPFRGDSREEILEKITTVEPRPPRQIDDAIPREIERICLKALSKRATERYSTARDFAEDLLHFFDTNPALHSTHLIRDANGPYAGRATRDAVARPKAVPATPNGLQIKIVPKGLCAFDERDADFFLELLPGPRDRDGLPDALRYWKTRIEESDPDKTFRVGLIYGPSGCGKSSLIKAGLLPRLTARIAHVYIEATASETQARLLRGLRRRFPEMPAEPDLAASLARLRRSRELLSGKKLLIVLDQFEQWLFAHNAEQESELVTALRQCDGEHLQTICLVRDDFWMAATRFMKELEIDLVPDENVAPVDLFDRKHARKVLAAYGGAYQTLAAESDKLTGEQNAFLDRAVGDLAQDGRVVPVRLALFAEMIKGQAWTPATLREVGGTEGVGVRFLDETFSSERSNPRHRYHRKAAEAVLKSLLPEPTSDIKGRMRSIDELRSVSGYTERSDDFADLLRILDKDTRLITPVDLESSLEERAAPTPMGGRYYQLTHDYLVHSLRDWITRKQRETRRGRAELLLAERAALWNAKPENRHLPSVLEWTRIRILTSPGEWTEPLRRMMKRANRVLAVKAACFLALLGALVGFGLLISHQVIEDGNARHASGLVDSLMKAEMTRIPEIVDSMQAYRRWTDTLLWGIVRASPGGTKEKLYASLALLPVDKGQADCILSYVPKSDPVQLSIIGHRLAPVRDRTLIKRLWTELDQAKADDRGILPLASLLAQYEPSDPAWSNVRAKVAGALVLARLEDVVGWVLALGNVGGELIDPLAVIFRDKARQQIEQTVAVTALAHIAWKRPAYLVDLLLDAEPKAFAILLPVVALNRDAALANLRKAVGSATAGPPDRAAGNSSLRNARAAVALMRLNDADQVWQLLEHSADPEVRSMIISLLHPLGVNPSILTAELERLATNGGSSSAGSGKFPLPNAYLFEPSTSKKRAILMALSDYPLMALESPGLGNFVATVAKLYSDDADAGVHSAAKLLLARWGYNELPELQAAAPRKGEPFQKRWYVNRVGHTMVLIDGPVEFTMGSPETEPDRLTGEQAHRRIIPHRFAIAAQEVTVEEFQRFAREILHSPYPYSKEYSPSARGPQIDVTWFQAAAYCNWLSDAEGLPRCYEQTSKGEFAAGMRINAEAAENGGYRLPTDAEWEYACRAGSVTSRYFGNAPDLIGRYEWYVSNSDYHARPCGLLLPNDLGLFDTLGNAWEWCLNVPTAVAKDANGPVEDPFPAGIVDNDDRRLRGGRYSDAPPGLRAAGRVQTDPRDRRVDIGFRPARTVP
jgi:eukaryotic-like serine/threonine-protein kinase